MGEVRLWRKTSVTQEGIEAWIGADPIEMRVDGGISHAVRVGAQLIGFFERGEGLVFSAQTSV